MCAGCGGYIHCEVMCTGCHSRVTACLSIAQTGCGGRMKLLVGKGVGCMLIMDSGGCRDLTTGIHSIIVGP